MALDASWVDGDDSNLQPEELRAVARANPERQAEFATGRRIARRLLAAWGLPPIAIGVGPLREPLWPPGVFGSIAHAGKLCSVALSRRLPLGIDLEFAQPLERDVYEEIVNASERSGAPLGSLTTTALFCAKECFQKARTFHARRWFEFREVSAVEIAEVGDAWRLELSGPAGIPALRVCAARAGNFLVAAGF